MDEKLKFIARYLEGEKMAPLCREFGITRLTGYKLIERYKMMAQCGEFMLGNKQYCYPLTISDYASRYLLSCEALSSTRENFAFEIFERAFKEHGLPDSIRTDNGVPFASGNSFYNLTRLSV